MNIIPTRITVSPAPESLAAPNLATGDTIRIVVGANAPLSVIPSSSGSLPTLSLNDGAIATFSSIDAAGALVFTSTVAAGQATQDLLVTGLFDNGATIDSLGVDGFTNRTTLPAPSAPTSVIGADLSGTGTIDLVTANVDGTISILRGNGDGSFQAPASVASTIHPTDLIAADLANTGTPDIVAIDHSSGMLEVLPQSANGSLLPPVASVYIGSPDAVTTGDFNGDGKLDVAVVSQQNDYVQVLFGAGDGTFASSIQITTGAAPAQIVATRLIRGGATDLAVTNSADNTVTLMFGDGTGYFPTTTTLNTGRDPQGIVAADFTGNGIMDLAVANSADGTIGVYLGRGDGTFAPPEIFAAAPGVTRLQAVDLTGSGHLDLVALNPVDNTVSVLRGNGDGTFQTRAVYADGAALAGVATAVVAATGSIDLVLANTAGAAGGGLTVLHNSGTVGIDPTAAGTALDATTLPLLAGADTGLAINPAHQNRLVTLGTLDPTTTGTITDTSLAVDASGAVYAISATGGSAGHGVIDELSADHTTLTQAWPFDGQQQGSTPSGGLAMDGAGNLYGTTSAGGANGDGVLFRLTPDHILQEPATFASTTGPSNPSGQLLVDAAGDVFGTTQGGGTAGAGAIFEYNAQSGILQDLASFDGAGLGGQPGSGVVADSSGNLFGTTQSGGADGYGTLFEYFAATSTLMTLASFNFATNGYLPSGPLVTDKAGNVYGVTEGGGAYYSGTVFEYVAATGSLDVLYNFTGGKDGSTPVGGVIRDGLGNLFGVTQTAGRYGGGTVFELSADRQSLITLVNFPGGANNGTPVTGLVADAAGNLFGATQSAPSGAPGTLFEVQDSAFGATVICFYPGTRVRTPSGERRVEDLAIGDLVLTAGGGAEPIRWIGRQTVSTRFADPLRVLPIRISAGALDGGLPLRDLMLSPDHAVALDELLIQAAALVNGTTITREADVPEQFVYYHIELASHALILAEGQPVETFIDNVERMAFDNWAEHAVLYGGRAEMKELEMPRAKSRRQVPRSLRERIDALAGRGLQAA